MIYKQAINLGYNWSCHNDDKRMDWELKTNQTVEKNIFYFQGHFKRSCETMMPV